MSRKQKCEALVRYSSQHEKKATTLWMQAPPVASRQSLKLLSGFCTQTPLNYAVQSLWAIWDSGDQASPHPKETWWTCGVRSFITASFPTGHGGPGLSFWCNQIGSTSVEGHNPHASSKGLRSRRHAAHSWHMHQRHVNMYGQGVSHIPQILKSTQLPEKGNNQNHRSRLLI